MASHSASSSRSASPRYYCHRCEAAVVHVSPGLTCSICGDGFLEELPPSTGRGGTAMGGVNPIPGSFHFQMPTGGNVNPMQVFIEQLLTNLAAPGGTGGGGHIQLQFNDNAPSAFHIHGNIGDYAWGAGGLDQIVTQLLNQIEGGAAPLTQQQLINLPMCAVENSSQCTTCMENFELNERVASLNCAHIFHKDCIVPWLLRHSTCPICRANVDPSGWKPVIDDLD